MVSQVENKVENIIKLVSCLSWPSKIFMRIKSKINVFIISCAKLVKLKYSKLLQHFVSI